MLFNATLYAPILMFFVRRAYFIWDRQRVVLISGYTIVSASFVMAVIAWVLSSIRGSVALIDRAGSGLRTPWDGFGLKSNEEFAQGIAAFGEMMNLYSSLQVRCHLRSANDSSPVKSCRHSPPVACAFSPAMGYRGTGTGTKRLIRLVRRYPEDARTAE